jgi:hypothetical protein
MLALRNQLIRACLHILVEQNPLCDLRPVVLIAAFELVQQHQGEEPLHPTVLEVVVDQVVVEDVVRQWDAHAPDKVIDHPVVVDVDVRHLVVPFLVVWVEDKGVHGEHGRRFLGNFKQVHDLVDRLIAAVAWATEDRHPRFLVPQPEELNSGLVPVHF